MAMLVRNTKGYTLSLVSRDSPPGMTIVWGVVKKSRVTGECTLAVLDRARRHSSYINHPPK